ncbi:hypothetical protein FC093_01595 [Ilyomonas limi]|uniref:SMP-30/Gluconolactonase/LRE-like region domain-containing protein n=1 Tax=Ilyomonas limi TaxID=2575867 RepID=A0A4V5UV54_9BACT|nr:hypothetical protein [Ilyomonas limi]TKK71743.1 hypothetical protein FC093_01595 [Ilyomonas limi]
MFIGKLILFIAIGIIACSSCNKDKIRDTAIAGDRAAYNAVATLVNTSNVKVTTIAGKLDDPGNAQDGNGSNARFWNPTKMVYDSRNNLLYVADGTVIRSIDGQNNVKTYVPLGAIGSSYNEILDMDVAPGTAGGTLYIITKENDLWKIVPNGTSGKATNIVNRIYGGNAVGALNSGDHFDLPNGLATGANGEIYFFNEAWNTMHRITLSGAKTGTVSTFAGKPLTVRGGTGTSYPYKNGLGDAATFGSRVSDLSADTVGNIYVADLDNELVRKVTPAGKVTALFQYTNKIGSDLDGPVSSATSNNVTQVSARKDGKMIFFTTYGNANNGLSALRVVRPGNDVTTLVGYG